MCKVIISLTCSHVSEYVIHQISAQIDFIDLKIIFYICFLLPGFFFMCLEHYNFQVYFPLSKHVSSKEENLYPVLPSLLVTGIACSSPDGSFLCHMVQTCFDSETPKSFPDGSCCRSRCDCSCPPYRTEK